VHVGECDLVFGANLLAVNDFANSSSFQSSLKVCFLFGIKIRLISMRDDCGRN